jgi:hypothetical protein
MKLTAAGKVWCIVAALLIDKGLTLFGAPQWIGMDIFLASLIIPNIPDWVRKFRKTEATPQK